jgi:hypothetical protein
MICAIPHEGKWACFAYRPIAKRHLTKRDGSKVAKLAILAANAVRNADLHRALELLQQILTIYEGASAADVNLKLLR